MPKFSSITLAAIFAAGIAATTVGMAHATEYLPASVSAEIKAKCIGEWPSDYVMQRYCIERQEKAYIDVYGSYDPNAEWKPGGIYYDFAPTGLAMQTLCGNQGTPPEEREKKIWRKKDIQAQAEKFVTIARKHPKNLPGICNNTLSFDGTPIDPATLE